MKHPNVKRYDEHMPKTDDATLVVLKGHLLIEEMLVELAEVAFANPQYLHDANLGFYKLACVVRAAVQLRADDTCWQLILSLNSFRNDLAHNLESAKRQDRLNALFRMGEEVRPVPGWKWEVNDSTLSDSERLRYVIMDCMEFLLQLKNDMLMQRTFGGQIVRRTKHPATSPDPATS